MKVLVIGSGGREHALVWKIAQSRLVDKIFAIPGNGGISEIAECLEIKTIETERILSFARKEKIDITVVGPEAPLVLGIVDDFTNHGLKIFGPTASCARLEESKVFAKTFMAKYSVPTAEFKVFDNPSEAKNYIEQINAPCVVKADGLAAGKGVIVAQTIEEAKQAVVSMMEEKVFGDAGKKIIIEECLEGQEASILIFTDSKEVVPLASSQDHKRLLDGDRGPNTGGMGAYSPAPVVTEAVFKEILEKIINKTIAGLNQEGMEYRGVLYAGIMLTKNGPKVLEFNVRFGDPETQAIIPRVASDLLEGIIATSCGTLGKFLKAGGFKWDSRACVSVVCASAGYPGEFAKDKPIFGLKEAKAMKDVIVFHAGTKRLPQSSKAQSDFVTSGGRVLGVTGLGNTIKEAIGKAYQTVGKINFEGMQYRKDIGNKALL
ncbi:MAG: phosphoribosylamine--glycine ligase [Candidatus Omnitrophica bacterium]|nr:phosphoribosylamine--glycine ligase [Candidatus Omnitrophota bacterium]